MPELMDHVAYLSQEIGPRPAGTEEEQQAALYITEQFQKEAGLPAMIEDFSSASNAEIPRAICYFLTFVAAGVSLFLPVALIPAIVLTVIAAILLVLEVLRRPVISRLMSHGVSQNVVAKYDPGYAPGGSGTRRRKVVLVARYDSGKVRPELNSGLRNAIPAVQWAALGAMVLIPIILVIRSLFFLHAEGTTAIVLNVIVGIGMLLVAIPMVVILAHGFMAYNEAANANASGVAVMLDIAQRIGNGRVSAESLAGKPAMAKVVVHGEDEARAAGLVPEGARLTYEASQIEPPDIAPQSPEARLAAAKAAIAALTGKPVSGAEPVHDIAEHLVQVKDFPLAAPTDEAVREQRDETREALSGEGSLEHPFENSENLDGVEHIDSASEQGREVNGTTGEPTEQAPHAEEGEAAHTSQASAAGFAAGALSASAWSAQPSHTSPTSSVPDWFAKAQEAANARKPKEELPSTAYRSQYADALDAALAQPEEEPERKQPSVFAGQQTAAAVTTAAALAAGNAGWAAREDADAAAPASPLSAAQVPSASPAAFDDAFADVFGDVSAPSPLDASIAAQPSQQQQETPAQALPDATTAIAPIDVSDLKEQWSSQTAVAPQRADAEPLAQEARPSAPAFAPVTLPEIQVGSTTNLPPLTGAAKQRAPLADAQQSGATAAKSLLTMLPAIDVEEVAAEKEGRDPSQAQRSGQAAGKAALLSLPSLSGEISLTREMPGGAAANAQASSLEAGGAHAASGAGASVQASGSPDSAEVPGISKASAFVAASATGSFEPVGTELLRDVDPDEIYIEDADDSDYDTGITETGAFTGPGYVEMPKSRVRRFFDKFSFRKHREDEEETTSTQEWLDVDEDFDARSVGAARGSWESFRQDDDNDAGEYNSDQAYDVYDDAYAPYEGSYGDGYAEEYAEEYADEYRAEYGTEAPDAEERSAAMEQRQEGRHSRRWQGGAFSRMRARAGRGKSRTEEDAPELDAVRGEDEAEYPKEAAQPQPEQAQPFASRPNDLVAEEVESIYQFRHPDIDTEIWFVALGSGLSDNAGMNAFLAEHSTELRGAIIVNLEALGAGDLCLIEREGAYVQTKTSSRMKRYIRKASQATGVQASSAAIPWMDTASSVALKHGFQAMSIMGMDGTKPALFAQRDDSIESIDPAVLRQNAEFVMEVLKNI